MKTRRRINRQWLRIAAAVASLMLLTASSLAGQAGGEPDAVTQHFEFFNDAKVNLHHFLINWASADADQRPRYAPALTERTIGLATLTEAERTAWEGAVAAYARAVDRSFVFDEGLVAVRGVAAGIGSAEAVPEQDRTLLEALDRALDVYRTHWWPDHKNLNRAWIDDLMVALPSVEGGIVRRLEAAYGGSWPAEPIRVDVVAYANYVGAYSTGGIVTVASGDDDNRMPQAVEMVFHESSHIDPLEIPLREGVSRAFEEQGAEEPDRLWHDVLFYTAGEATRLELAAHGNPDYQHYGSFGAYRRGERWPPQLAAFEAHWRPFLESHSSAAAERQTALHSVVEALTD